MFVYQGTASGTNTYTVTTTPTHAAYAANDILVITFTNANSGASTLNDNSLGARTLQYNGAAMVGGEIQASSTLVFKDNGTNLQLLGDANLLTTKGDFLTYSTVPVRKAIGTNGYLIVADSTQAEGWKWAPGPGAAGITVGLDKDRPSASASTSSFYQTTDSLLLYSSDQTRWLVAGSIPDNFGLGPFSDSNFLRSLFTGAAIAPTMTNPYTILFIYYITTLPGTTGPIFMVNMQTAFTDGWYFGGSTTNSNKMRFTMRGVNSSADNEFTNFTLTTGAHATAVSYDGSNLKMVHDASAAQTIATTGSFTAPAASARFQIGRYTNAGNSAPGMIFFSAYGYSSALSTGDMQTLTTNPSAYFPGGISTTPAWVFTTRVPPHVTALRTWGTAAAADGTSYMQTQGTLQGQLR